VLIGIERRSLPNARNLFRVARIGGHGAGLSGSDASMSDADPGLTSWGRESTAGGVFSTALDAGMVVP
jgi:hypothetical protein